jgi:peptidoglycan/xylan/chitin deacetylase (PgdA/CDA1 family)
MALLPILTFHFVGDHPHQRHHRSIFCHAPVFAAQMRLLRRLGWQTLTLAEAGHLAASGAPVPSRRFVLTFDDGDADLWWSVRPVLKQHGFTASAFIVSGRIGGTNDWEDAPTLAGRPLLNAEQLRAMAVEGWDIGGHTINHADLTTLDEQGLEREIRGSRTQLEETLGQPVTSFSYPSGRVHQAAREATVRAGFTVAVTTEKGWVHSGMDPLLLPRVSVSHRAGPLGLLWRMLKAR